MEMTVTTKLWFGESVCVLSFTNLYYFIHSAKTFEGLPVGESKPGLPS